MAVSVTKAGPYFTSGEIKWSEFRSKFKEKSSGPVSASELFRDVRLAERDPIVPDSTENTSIPVDSYPNGTFSGNSNNWKASLMRNSIKRYTANQSGDNKFLDLGLKSGSDGIDWDGQNDLDTVGKTTGNYTRNVQKIINITGRAFSDDTGTNGLTGDGGTGKEKKPAAKLVLPDPLKALNVRLYVTGGIYGSAGRSGFYNYASQPDKTLSDPGKDGGPALTIRHMGSESRTYIYNQGGEIFGGGGGGEQGQMGAWPTQAGICQPASSTSCSTSYYLGGYNEGCHGSGTGGCPSGGSVYASLHIATLPCPPGTHDDPSAGYGSISADYCRVINCTTYTPSPCSSTTPEQGLGGAGGEGAGWGYRQAISGGKQTRTLGQPGRSENIYAKCVDCAQGQSPSGATNSTPGGKGGDGGDYGQPGGNTLGKSPVATGLAQGEGGGKGGAAICGKYFKTPIFGSTGSANVKGSVGLECDGSEGTPDPVPDMPTITASHAEHIRFNYPAIDNTNKQTLNVTSAYNSSGFAQGPVRCKLYFWWKEIFNIGSYGVEKIEIKKSDGTLVWSVEVDKSKQRGNNLVNGDLPITEFEEGIYDVIYTGLSFFNQPSSGANWLINDRIMEYGQKLRFFDDTQNLTSQNSELVIAPADATFDSGDGKTTRWIESYNSQTMGNKLEDGSWEYIAIQQYWSQFMRDYAMWGSNDPGTQDGTDQDYTTTWLWNIPDVSKEGEYTFEIESDNLAEWTIDGVSKGKTTDYDSHYPANDAVSKMGKWVDTQTGTSYTDGTPYKQSFAVGNHTISIKVTNKAFPPGGNDPENWQYNPAGVAFRVTFGGQEVFNSTDVVMSEGTTYGRSSISWVATNVDTSASSSDSIFGTDTPMDASFNVTKTLQGTTPIAPTSGSTVYKLYAKNDAGTSNPVVINIK